MIMITSDTIRTADALLRRNMLRNEGLWQGEIDDTSYLSKAFMPPYAYYVSKPYIAELRVKQASEEEFDKKIAKLKIFNTDIGISELLKYDMKINDVNRYIMKDLSDDGDVIIEIEEEPAFTDKDWKTYRKYKDVFKEELDTCMYEITTKESLARAGIVLNEIQEEEETLKVCLSEFIDKPDRSSYELPEEVPIRYAVTISSKTPIDITCLDNIKDTMFTCMELNDNYIWDEDEYIDTIEYVYHTSEKYKFIYNNPMLKKLDISGIKPSSIKRIAGMVYDNSRFKTIIADLSNINLSEEELKESKTSGIKLVNHEL